MVMVTGKMSVIAMTWKINACRKGRGKGEMRGQTAAVWLTTNLAFLHVKVVGAAYKVIFEVLLVDAVGVHP